MKKTYHNSKNLPPLQTKSKNNLSHSTLVNQNNRKNNNLDNTRNSSARSKKEKNTNYNNFNVYL